MRHLALVVLACIGLVAAWVQPAPLDAADNPKEAKVPEQVSYHRDVRPILVLHCQGCHQPARPLGGYVTTSVAALLEPGESGEPGVVPGKPEASRLIQQITSHDGQRPAMPKGRDPLTEHQVAILTRWIAQGAKDDTPASQQTQVTQDNPPTYELPPVITALDFSPDGNLLAVSGYHEVLVHKADGSGLLARLVGLSERIQSLVFSPDGKRLAVTGGSPGRFGEVQVWEIQRPTRPLGGFTDAGMRLAAMTPVPAWTLLLAAGPAFLEFGDIPTGEITGFKLRLSHLVTYDTIYGASWSPDGSKIAFGCADNTLRAIDAATGQQVLYQGAHNDWVLDTTFSVDGQHLVSVSRDRSMKLTEVATQRFIDNVTSITPGALKGGLMTVDRRPVVDRKWQKVPPDTPNAPPKRYDEILAAGSDGTPRLFKMHREAKRVIGDDFNKIREYPSMPGRIYSVRFSPDGKRFVAGSSLEGKGEARIYSVDEGKVLARLEGDLGPIYAVAFHVSGEMVAVAGFQGVVRLHDATTGKLIKEFAPAPIKPNVAAK
jgi:WD40 repeat protein